MELEMTKIARIALIANPLLQSRGEIAQANDWGEGCAQLAVPPTSSAARSKKLYSLPSKVGCEALPAKVGCHQAAMCHARHLHIISMSSFDVLDIITYQFISFDILGSYLCS